MGDFLHQNEGNIVIQIQELYEMKYFEENECWICCDKRLGFRTNKQKTPVIIVSKVFDFQKGCYSLGNYAFQRIFQERPKGIVRRTCKDNLCINPEHLYYNEGGGFAVDQVTKCCFCFNMIMQKGWKDARCTALCLKKGQPVSLQNLFINDGLLKSFCGGYESTGHAGKMIFRQMIDNFNIRQVI